MTPYQQIMGANTPVQGGGGYSGQPQMGGPFGAFGGVLQRAQQLAGSFRNPQQMVSQFFPDAPAEVSGNPEQLLGWLQQTGKVNPQMVQMARMMTGR